jgi:glyoxylase-like metal-dependent hydrolase (beta-lactamase superfamily II)
VNPYKIYLLKYARRDATSTQYILGDLHMTPMDMAYYIWAVTNGEHTVVVDMGFTRPIGEKRNRQWLAEPAALLDSIGVDPRTVEHVVVTHMHWDHVGNYRLFPKARFYVQEDEMAFWTGKYVQYSIFGGAMEVDDVCALVRHNFEGRVGFTNGSQEILPGIKVHKASGHTKGIQMVEVATASGTAVVASDVTHTYRNLRENRPHPVLHDIPNYLDSLALLRRLAKDENHILPGHDSDAFKRHKQVSEFVAVLE